jgi:hypothetical protein
MQTVYRSTKIDLSEDLLQYKEEEAIEYIHSIGSFGGSHSSCANRSKCAIGYTTGLEEA